MKSKIGYVGITHLALCSSVAAAEKGFSVLALDLDSKNVNALKDKKLPVVEPQLTELFQKNFDKFEFSSDFNMLQECDLVYVAPDIPTDEFGKSDLEPIKELIEKTNKFMSPDAVMVILSQVPPGFTRTIKRDKKYLYYQVETLIFGSAIERALYPERFIVGCFDKKQPLNKYFDLFLKSFSCPILPMKYESAEFAKISINTYLVASVSVTNMLAEVCEQIGADWHEIIPSLQLDKRIGKYAYLSPGLGFAGGNLERDLTTIQSLSQIHGTDSRLVKSFKENSQYRSSWVLKILHQKVLPGLNNPKIGILGLSYKPNTHSIKNSPSIKLLKDLCNYKIFTYDPIVKLTGAGFDNVVQCESALSVFNQSNILIFMTPWKEFKDLNVEDVTAGFKGNKIIDPYGLIDIDSCDMQGINHFKLGMTI